MGAPNASGVAQNRRLSTNNRLNVENGTNLSIVVFSLITRKWNPLIVRFRDSHTGISRSCKLTGLRNISSNCFKSRKIGYNIKVKTCYLCVFLFHKVM